MNIGNEVVYVGSIGTELESLIPDESELNKNEGIQINVGENSNSDGCIRITFNCIKREVISEDEEDILVKIEKESDASEDEEASLAGHECPLCQKWFSKMAYLKRHMARHEKPTYVCKICKEQLPDRVSLVLHKRIHVVQAVPDCKACGKSFAERKNLIHHVKTQHPDQSEHLLFPCSYCRVSFLDEESKNAHEVFHTMERQKAIIKERCKACHKQFAEKRLLIGHIKRLHPERAEELLLPCRYCRLTFFDEEVRSSHEEGHAFNDTCFTCFECDKTFPSLKNLRSHSVSRHANPKEPLYCGVCNASFSQNSQLDRHVKMKHAPTSEEEHYECGACGMIFTRRYSLQRHQIVHTPREKQFACNICNKNFLSEYYVKRHQKVYHVGGKKFTCTWCGKKFFRNSYLKKHMISTHGISDAQFEELGVQQGGASGLEQ